MSKKRFLKQMHKEKIEKEKVKPVPDLGLIKYWEREVKVYTDEIEKAKRRLNRGR